MSAARLTHETIDAEFVDIGDQRRRDRRDRERRSARATFDTLFAATLVNHVASPERARDIGYRDAPQLRPGIVVNIRA